MTEATVVVEMLGNLDIALSSEQGLDHILFLTDSPCHSGPRPLDLEKSDIWATRGFAHWRQRAFSASRFAPHDSGHDRDNFGWEVSP